jgi:hypothetical protein
MKLTLMQHAGNPNMCRIPELTIRAMPKCEGGGWYLPRRQAEFLVRAAEAVEDTTVDSKHPLPTWAELVDYWKARAEAAEGSAVCSTPATGGGPS